jgi:ABC-type iron transport system FetAB permease component
MQASGMWLDRMVGRLLFVSEVAPGDAQTAERAFGFSLLVSAVRCILQYAVLPFVLPLVGIASDAALPILLLINVLAIGSIFYSLRRFWKVGYQYRWQYLGVAMAALLILSAFIMLDIQKLFGA